MVARTKAQACAELEVNQKWMDLRDCASELAALGAHDRDVQARAEQLRVKAVEEIGNARAASKLTEALNEGDLREAQQQLKSIGADSVYAPAASDAFRAAEEQAIAGHQRQALGLASAHDCAALRRLLAQVSESSTSSVTEVVAAVQCDRAPPSAEEAAATREQAAR